MRNHKPLVFILKHRVVGLRCTRVSLKYACVTPKGHRILVLCLIIYIGQCLQLYSATIAVYSQLLTRNIRVTHLAVRNAMHRIDPQGVAMRWLQLVPRRSYNVPGPLSLWHIDGNHKLIR